VGTGGAWPWRTGLLATLAGEAATSISVRAAVWSKSKSSSGMAFRGGSKSVIVEREDGALLEECGGDRASSGLRQKSSRRSSGLRPDRRPGVVNRAPGGLVNEGGCFGGVRRRGSARVGVGVPRANKPAQSTPPGVAGPWAPQVTVEQAAAKGLPKPGGLAFKRGPPRLGWGLAAASAMASRGRRGLANLM
jgi:hypothetical protein